MGEIRYVGIARVKRVGIYVWALADLLVVDAVLGLEGFCCGEASCARDSSRVERCVIPQSPACYRLKLFHDALCGQPV